MYHINGFVAKKKKKKYPIINIIPFIKYYLKKNFSIKLIFIQRKK